MVLCSVSFASGSTMDPSESKNVPELSVVILCYRAGKEIASFVEQIDTELHAAEIDFELVLVANYDEGTDDPTPKIATELAEREPRYRCVCQVKQGRMGWDMRSGLSEATGHLVAVIDGDGQMPSSDIVPLFRLMSSGQYDLAKTFRAKRHDGAYRKIMSSIYNWLFHILFRPEVRFRDVNAKPKIITREALTRLNLVSNDWFTDAEIMIEATDRKLRVCELSTVFYENERRSSFVSFGTAFEFVGNLFYYRFLRTRKSRSES